MWSDIARKLWEKTLAAVRRNGDAIPYIAGEDGLFDDHSGGISWWTNGFWAGSLWQMYALTGKAELMDAARAIEGKLDAALTDAQGMDHDSGFKWLLTAGADYALTKNPASLNRLLLAASNLAGRFNPAGNFIRAWNDGTGEKAGLVIIDCLMNLPLLYRASQLTGDPRFAQIAALHARTAAKHFMRPDGSVEHIVLFDPATGERTGTLGGQGMGPGSAWSRGQAWALYGFALSYRHTGERVFLDCARRSADYFTAHIPASGLIPADFCQDADCAFEDDSAAACAACGLLELAERTGEEGYAGTARRLLTALTEKRADLDPATDRVLTHCTVSFHDKRHNHPLIYADYFYTEAVARLAGEGVFLW